MARSPTSGDLTAVATSTCPVARGRSWFAFSVAKTRRGRVAAEGALGIDHPARWVGREREWAEHWGLLGKLESSFV